MPFPTHFKIRRGLSCTDLQRDPKNPAVMWFNFAYQVVRNDLSYREIQEFLCIPALSVAFVKPFTEVVTNICKNAINSSSDTNVKQFCSKKLLGSRHTPVSFSTDSILIAVLCNDILAKCIVVKTN